MMVLADTSVWVDHFRVGNDGLRALLEGDRIMMHSFVLGELMLGGIHRRHDAMRELRALPAAPPVTAEDVSELIEAEALHGRGIGYVDAVLLASVRLRPGARLWTLDRKLHAVAESMKIAIVP